MFHEHYDVSLSIHLCAHPVQPVCRPGQKILYGVAKQETVVVQCQTDAIPPVEHTSFFKSIYICIKMMKVNGN